MLGHNTLKEYIDYEGERFIGCVVGRYANRIAKGQFTIDSITYNVPINNNGQSLHGGLKGLDQVVWDVDTVGKDMIRLSYLSPDGAEGYPGNLKIEMTYSLTPENEFKITYRAVTDKPTVVNLSHHGFFNLKGEGAGTINDHLLTINADSITPVDSVLIPTGALMAVEGTPFDFRKATAIGERVNDENEQLKNGNGYDHNFCINGYDGSVRLAATATAPNGVKLDCFTDMPGTQLYVGNFLCGKIGKNGVPMDLRTGFCLETQYYPNATNTPSFKNCVFDKDEVMKSTTIYKVTV